jgi:hypothetical protein
MSRRILARELEAMGVAADVKVIEKARVGVCFTLVPS